MRCILNVQDVAVFNSIQPLSRFVLVFKTDRSKPNQYGNETRQSSVPNLNNTLQNHIINHTISHSIIFNLSNPRTEQYSPTKRSSNTTNNDHQKSRTHRKTVLYTKPDIILPSHTHTRGHMSQRRVRARAVNRYKSIPRSGFRTARVPLGHGRVLIRVGQSRGRIYLIDRGPALLRQPHAQRPPLSPRGGWGAPMGGCVRISMGGSIGLGKLAESLLVGFVVLKLSLEILWIFLGG